MLRSLLCLFIQSDCTLCQRPTQAIVCSYCQKKIHGNRLLVKTITNKGSLPVLAWGKYEGQLKRAIALLKYENKPQLGIMLGEWLGQSWLATTQGKKMAKLTVVPIPLHQQKLKIRGFNQSASIAQGFCQVTGYTLNSQVLIRTRNTEAMFGLNPQQRKANVTNAFVIHKNFDSSAARSPILLIDDIYTTGSTIQEARQALISSSFDVYSAAVVAIVPDRTS